MVNNKIQSAEENLIRVYNRFPVVLDHGEGMYLYDTDGKEYLDFAAGFAVCGLGYGNKELAGVLKDQIDRLYHTAFSLQRLQNNRTGFVTDKSFHTVQIIELCEFHTRNHRLKRIPVCLMSGYRHSAECPSVKRILHGNKLISACLLCI